MRALILALALGLFVTACGGASETMPPPDDGDDYPGAEEPELAEHAETARKDLANSLGVPEEDLTIVIAERVTWSNGALGCEEEGMSYTQALVEGYRVEVQHDGEPYHYHGAEGEPPTYCPEPSEPAQGS